VHRILWTVTYPTSTAQAGQSYGATTPDARQRFYQVFRSHLKLETVRRQLGRCHYFNRCRFIFFKTRRVPSNCLQQPVRNSSERACVVEENGSAHVPTASATTQQWTWASSLAHTQRTRQLVCRGGRVTYELEMGARNAKLPKSLRTYKAVCLV
jgi:hypothetical protein